MAKCKFCGQGVRSGPVFHTGCWEQAVNKLASEFCDEYCKFPFEMDYEALVDKPYESLLLPLYIDEDTAQGYSYTSSIDSDVYNRIKLAWDNDETGVREVHVMNNTASQSKWGTLQYYEKLDNALNTADLQTKAKALMKYYNVIHRELTMQKAFGDVRARAGTSVCVGMGLGDINIKNYMCVEKAKHTFSNGLYTMDLYLSGIRGEFSA